MKKNLLFLFLSLVSVGAIAQESMEKIMEKRGRELVRVLGSADKEQWKKFIRENYTQALIDRKMRATIKSSDGNSESAENKTLDNIEEKANMFGRLHDDLGGGKITTLSVNGTALEVEVSGDEGGKLKFSLTFSKEKPYLIDGMGVQMQMDK